VAQPGDVLADRFEVRESLGAGGLAEVVRAFDRQVGGEVALKLLHPHLARDAVVRERFRREVQVTRTLDHPGIVRAFDLFEESGRVFFSMELLRGNTLADRVRDGPALGDSEIARIGREALEALAHAHAQGITHRDLKPHNVFLCADGRVKLLDFGTARLAGAARLTTHSGILGTPDYVAPEVLSGRGDQRADLYSLGATLYEALAGKPPFAGKTALELLKAHSETPPNPLPASRDGALSRAVMRALEKDPERRFRDAREFLAAMDGKLTPAPEVSEPPAREEPAPRAAQDETPFRKIPRVNVPDEVYGRRWWIEASAAPGNSPLVARRIEIALGREIPDLADRLERGPVVVARGLRHRDAERVMVELEQAGIPVHMRRAQGGGFPWPFLLLLGLPWIWGSVAALIGVVVAIVFGTMRWAFRQPQPRGRGVGQGGRRFGGRTQEEWERQIGEWEKQIEAWGRRVGEQAERYGKEIEERASGKKASDVRPPASAKRPVAAARAPKPEAAPAAPAQPASRVAPLLKRVEERAARVDKLARQGSPSRQRVAEDLTGAAKDLLAAARTLAAEARKIEEYLAGLEPEAEEWETVRTLRARMERAGSEEEKAELGEIVSSRERSLAQRGEMERKLASAENRLLRITAALDEAAAQVFGAGVADAGVTRPLRDLEKEAQFAAGAVREIDAILREGAPPPKGAEEPGSEGAPRERKRQAS
jgi:hypothetical protein